MSEKISLDSSEIMAFHFIIMNQESHNDISKYVCIRKRNRNRRSGKSDTWRK